jgi:hypothetical protein
MINQESVLLWNVIWHLKEFLWLLHRQPLLMDKVATATQILFFVLILPSAIS